MLSVLSCVAAAAADFFFFWRQGAAPTNLPRLEINKYPEAKIPRREKGIKREGRRGWDVEQKGVRTGGKQNKKRGKRSGN